MSYSTIFIPSETDCGQPLRVDYAINLNPSSLTTYNDTQTYTCQAGYTFPDGTTQQSIRCNETGYWEPLITNCSRKWHQQLLPPMVTSNCTCVWLINLLRTTKGLWKEDTIALFERLKYKLLGDLFVSNSLDSGKLHIKCVITHQIISSWDPLRSYLLTCKLVFRRIWGVTCFPILW